MRLLFASDIHGSASAARKMLELYEEGKGEELILLGDILYHGPRNDLPDQYAPKEVIALLSPYKDKILCVRGNCDTEVDQMVLPFPILSDSALMYLDGRRVFLHHGHHQLPPLSAGDIVISGHTHIPGIEVKEQIFMNPGSISLPKGGFPPSLMWYDDGVYTIKSLDGRELVSWRS